MPITKKRILNIVFYVLLIAIVFTPLGFKVKVFTSRVFSGSATVLNEQEQVMVQNFNWKFVDANGNNFNLNNYQGKVIFINFWATWCPPCVAEMPSLQKLYTDYKNDVEFIFLASDKVNKVKAYLNDNNFSFNVYYSNYMLPKELKHTVIPTTFVLNKSGKIIIKETSAKNWNSEKTRKLLDKLLKE
ncbi:TlpA family protein disulfide reductase [Cellulophaga omnivescoria]|uniref:TlpA family protein disulfide reductase n=1 Tax=Cellulophaga omnivescoria TaxID=1888890 RepID=UPI0009865EA3|nr:TlpA disulfide reductase family protein [Cellulophaga omnivescoria]